MKPRDAASLRKRTEEFGLALGLLTRIPLPTFQKRTEASISSAFWAYPLAGALVGVSAAAAFWLSITAGFNAIASALLALAVALIVSGGFHEDGLSDFWDGLGGGASRNDKLAIMRDSRIGAYGALALFLALSLQVSFIVNLQHYAGLANVMVSLIATEAVARGAIALPLACLRTAREDGLGRSMTDLHLETLAIGIALAILIPLLLLDATAALSLISGAVIGAACIAFLASHFLGGFTGEVLGATATTSRIAGLGALVLTVTP